MQSLKCVEFYIILEPKKKLLSSRQHVSLSHDKASHIKDEKLLH